MLNSKPELSLSGHFDTGLRGILNNFRMPVFHALRLDRVFVLNTLTAIPSLYHPFASRPANSCH